VGSVQPGPTPIIDPGQPAPPLDGLVTATGPFDLAALQGEPTIVFFGYTHCPDVCPATIGELVELVGRRPDVHVVFVTVDPERDTPEFMGEWTEFLPDSFVGVTGSPTAIKAAADAYGVRYARVDSASAAGYSMSHTAFQYLIDAEGRLRLHFPFGTGWESMLQTLDTIAPPNQEAPS
jgi:protein SCO1